MGADSFTEALESRQMMSASQPAFALFHVHRQEHPAHSVPLSTSAAKPVGDSSTLPAPVITTPGNRRAPGPVLTTSDPTFEWKAETGVTFTGYQINLEDLTKNKFVSYVVSADATHFTPPAGALGAGDKFVWNLRLRNGDTTGAESAYFFFQTPVTKLIAPTVVGPGDDNSAAAVVTDSDPTFTWKAVTGVSFSGYQINLYDETDSKFVSYVVSAGATQFTPPPGALASGDKFVWNLRLRRGDSTGPESAYFYFRTRGDSVQRL
jgi:hypothetical protein